MFSVFIWALYFQPVSITFSPLASVRPRIWPALDAAAGKQADVGSVVVVTSFNPVQRAGNSSELGGYDDERVVEQRLAGVAGDGWLDKSRSRLATALIELIAVLVVIRSRPCDRRSSCGDPNPSDGYGCSGYPRRP